VAPDTMRLRISSSNSINTIAIVSNVRERHKKRYFLSKTYGFQHHACATYAHLGKDSPNILPRRASHMPASSCARPPKPSAKHHTAEVGTQIGEYRAIFAWKCRMSRADKGETQRKQRHARQLQRCEHT